jgi:hypothetical protein
MIKSLLVKALFLAGLSLCQNKHYEESIPVLKIVENFVDGDQLVMLQYKLAVATHQIMQGKDSIYYCDAVLNSFYPVPRRYEVMCYLLKEDALTFKEDLLSTSRKMNDVVNRLEGSKAGQITQEKQKKILQDLDDKIKQLEDAEKQKDANMDTSFPAKSNPKPQSELPNDGPSEGKVLEQELKEAAKNWGTLPDLERAKIAQKFIDRTPLKYKPYVEAYFKALNKSEK